MKSVAPIFHAELDWDEQGQPRSRLYGDVYFSNEGGLAEAEHIFLQGNNLAERMANAKRFIIGETGFGSGLNFLAAWKLWQEVASKDARLCFFTVEKHPLRKEDMARIHALFPELSDFAQELQDNLPLLVPGFHRIYLQDSRVQLTLMYGDALEQLREQIAQADAWFLDGFAPRLNPDLWNAELAKEVRRLSAPDATLATFSTSENVMKAFAESGFTLQKKQGFGRKKYMLSGFLDGKPHFNQSPDLVTVIGGGLAGAATAYAFACRNVRVNLQEQKADLATGASANPSAIFYPGIASSWQKATQLYYLGYSYSLHLLKEFADKVQHQLCGMLLFAKPSDKEDKLEKVLRGMQPDASLFYLANMAEANKIAGVSVNKPAFYFPRNGWVNLADFTRNLTLHPLINITLSSETIDINNNEPTVLCNGIGSANIYPSLSSFMHLVRGQISCVSENDFPLKGLQTVLSYGGYASPSIHGVHHLGATFEREFEDVEPSQSSNEENICKLESYFEISGTGEASASWCALRTVSADRMPIVGKVEQNLYLNLAHGSRGLLTCAISGEYIASLAVGDPLPLPHSLLNLISFSRFT